MSLGEHFRELRNRLTISVLAVAVLSIVGWYWYEPIIDFISAPVDRLSAERGDDLVSLNFKSLTEPFAMRLKVAIFIGIFLASPIWLWQFWAFLLPGLTKREKKVSLAYFFAAVPLFLAGAAMAAWSFPRLYAILLSFTPDGFANLQSAADYLNVILYFCLAFAVAFLLPVVLVGANQLGLLPARQMLRAWRIVLFLILVFSAFMTPDPSAFTMIIMAMPIFALYWGAVAVSFLMERRRRKKGHRTASERYAGLSPDEATPLS